jgi:hypothetical protein
MNKFTGIFTNLDDTQIKKLYRKLAMENHPDLGGSHKNMQDLNEAYEMALQGIHGQEFDGRTYYYHDQNEKDAMEKLEEILAIPFSSAVEILLIGCWIWIKGTAREEKDLLNKNGAGCFWSREHKAWYWKPAGSYAKRSGKGLGDIAEKYGSKSFKSKGAYLSA